MTAGQGDAQVNVSTIPRTVSYQGYLESSGTPFDGVANFKFVISCGSSGTAWSNDGSSTGGAEPATAVPVQVDQGAFAVLLGDSTLNMPLIDPESFDGCTPVELRIWVDTGSGFVALPAQPVVSAMFALEADAAYRGIGGFIVDKGPLIVTDNLDQQVFQVIPYSAGPLDGPALYMLNSAANRTVSVVADSGGTGSPVIQLFDSAGTERIALDGATGELRAASIRFSDDTVQTTASGGGGGADADWTILGNDMYAAVPGNVGIGTSAPLGHLTIARPTQAPDHQIELRNEGSIQSGRYDGIRFTQGPAGETLLGEMRLDYRNNGVPDLGFHLRGQPNILYMDGDTGRVGVGTTTPDAPLEIAGSGNPILYVRQEQTSSADAVIAIRGSRNGTTTANIASVEFRDFDDDEGAGTDFLMARIGAGMDDISGQTGFLRFYTNNGSGGIERMRIDKSGNIGIGTDDPSATLDIVGDLEISGSVNVSAMTRYLAISSAAFTPELESMDFKNNGTDLYGTTPGQLVRFHAPVELPHGAVIKELRVVVDDLVNQLNANVTAYLYEWPLFGGSGAIVSHRFTSGAPGSYTQMVEAENQTVDNENNHYFVSVDWNTPGSGNVWDLRLRNMRITYEITQLAP
ncbi:hypothetical protein DRQ53_04060 [bacterium]|nr:MAG: hypothetical protein DRQ32_09645 [bacterium]RKZ17227.1 MAG: hypothetical protein DRQ53_04060 [bacterium]